jgi:hypothetical protein
MPSTFPVARIIKIDAKSGTQNADKRTLGWIHDDSSVTAPHSQITGLRICDPSKFINPIIEVG